MVIESSPLESVQVLSPKSTIITDTALMTTVIAVMNESTVASDAVGTADNNKLSSSGEGNTVDALGSKANPESPSSISKETNSNAGHKTDTKSSKEKGGTGREEYFPPTPNPVEYHVAQAHGYPVSLTPQTGSAYHYLSYGQQHITPEPPSPAGHPSVSELYNVGSFFHQPQAGALPMPPHQGPFGVNAAGAAHPAGSTSSSHNNVPMSPPRGVMPTVAMAMTMTGGIPHSPLFPRSTSGAATVDASGQQRGGAPPSPGIPYIMSPQQLGAASNVMYQTYPVAGVASRSSDEGTWGSGSGDRNQPNTYPSPQINSAGISVAYQGNRTVVQGRAYSFDDTMLPPSALDQDQSNPAYSPYSASQTSPGGTVFTHPPWGYGGHPDMYNTPGSPLQPRPQSQIPFYPGMPTGAMRSMGPYGQFYPASSPGPPIQMTASNKGPDGANLFIFHIPNHFTNLDMYQLFSPYGNLLSVRIMVEKDTGRSRGFGFVSYDAPEAAALAIKGLNGFAIGNKRLKVQHKQIRSRDLHDRDSPDDSFLGSAGDGSFQRPQFSSLPPSGPSANANFWSEPSRRNGTGIDGEVDANSPQQHDENIVEFASSSAGTDTSLQMGGHNAEEHSPLATMGQMQNTLPDIPGNGSANN